MNHYNQKVIIEFSAEQSREFLELLSALKERAEISSEKDSPSKHFLNIDETSVYLGIPKNTLYQYTSQRKIPFVKVGKQLIFDVTELKQWTKSLTKEVL
jgi:excisionase family DNA binding protein